MHLKFLVRTKCVFSQPWKMWVNFTHFFKHFVFLFIILYCSKVWTIIPLDFSLARKNIKMEIFFVLCFASNLITVCFFFLNVRVRPSLILIITIINNWLQLPEWWGFLIIKTNFDSFFFFFKYDELQKCNGCFSWYSTETKKT